jgi:hypothetical protein
MDYPMKKLNELKVTKLKQLATLASVLDSKGLHKEADAVDKLIRRSSYQDGLLEERNYMMDRRTHAKNAWEGYDQKSETITISHTRHLEDAEMTQDPDTDEWTEEAETTLVLPAKLEICDLCRGMGTVVDPSIDAGGLSREDFDEDPEFEEDYFGGVHDIPCPQCGGKRVVPVVDYQGLAPDQKKEFDEYQREQEAASEEAYNDKRTQMAEMGYGW